MILIVRRVVVPTPRAKGKSSWKALSGRWQVAQATLPLALKRVSKNNLCPNEAAWTLSAYLLEGSGGTDGSSPIHRERSVLMLASVQAELSVSSVATPQATRA